MTVQVLTERVALPLDGDEPTGDGAGMRLVDEVNGREHFVLEDSEGSCLCSTFDGVPPCGSVDVYAKFPAPPEGVDRVSLHVPS